MPSKHYNIDRWQVTESFNYHLDLFILHNIHNFSLWVPSWRVPNGLFSLLNVFSAKTLLHNDIYWSFSAVSPSDLSIPCCFSTVCHPSICKTIIFKIIPYYDTKLNQSSAYVSIGANATKLDCDLSVFHQKLCSCWILQLPTHIHTHQLLLPLDHRLHIICWMHNLVEVCVLMESAPFHMYLLLWLRAQS